MSLAATVVLSNKGGSLTVLDAPASAVVTPDAFYELGRSTTIVTFNLHQKSHQAQVTEPHVLFKGERRGFSWVHFQAN